MSNAAEPFHDYSVILETWSVSFNSVTIKSLNILLFLYTCQPLPEIFGAVRIFVVCRARYLEMMGNAFAFYVNITIFLSGPVPEDKWQTCVQTSSCYSAFCVFSLMFQLIRILGYEAMFLLHLRWESSSLHKRVYDKLLNY